MNFWGRKTFLMVTGASKGMGKECAVEFCKRIGPGSVALIAARTIDSLEPVKKIILANQKDASIKLGLFAQNMDQPDGKAFERKAQEFLAMNKVNPQNFDHAIMVHGAMTHFNFKTKALELRNAEDMSRYFTLNTFGPIVLNSCFMGLFGKDPKLLRSIINITSDAAEGPMNSLATLCAASSARESFLCSVARENNGVLVLNYNPGFLDLHVAGFKDSRVDDIEDLYKTILHNNQVTTCEKTVEKLIEILDGRRFFSGEHVNYHDLTDKA